MTNTQGALQDENTWIAMIGVVASTLVIFILMLIFIVPIDTKRVVLTTDDEKILIRVKAVSSEHLVIKNFQKVNNIEQIPDSLIDYIGANFDTTQKYFVRLRFRPKSNFSKGSNYENTYSHAKVSLLMLVKAGVPAENIRIQLIEDYSLPEEFPVIEFKVR